MESSETTKEEKLAKPANKLSKSVKKILTVYALLGISTLTGYLTYQLAGLIIGMFIGWVLLVIYLVHTDTL